MKELSIPLLKRRSDIPTGVFLCVESDITLSVVSFSYKKQPHPSGDQAEPQSVWKSR